MLVKAPSLCSPRRSSCCLARYDDPDGLVAWHAEFRNVRWVPPELKARRSNRCYVQVGPTLKVDPFVSS